jgi:hypothetical protein
MRITFLSLRGTKQPNYPILNYQEHHYSFSQQRYSCCPLYPRKKAWDATSIRAIQNYFALNNDFLKI